jgi:deoxyribodipyrimidine photolyase-related protein
MLILGDQLFPREHFQSFLDLPAFMAEDYELCARFKCHKHKLIFFLSAMRNQCDMLRAIGMSVDYSSLDSERESQFVSAARRNFESKLEEWILSKSITELVHFEIVDSFFIKRIEALCKRLRIGQIIAASPMFLDKSADIIPWMKKQKRPFMKSYYESRRTSTLILMEKREGKTVPIGGQFSFDAENRLALPKGRIPPELPQVAENQITKEVIALVDEIFPDHVGKAEDFWLPVSRNDALLWLGNFFRLRFPDFGCYEDALSCATPWLYHSVLSPLINSGLLTPKDVVSESVKFAKANAIPMNSLEGFVRQILGWREFVRGIYLVFEEKESQGNFFRHHRKLAPCWWDGTTGLLHLDRAINKAVRFGYCHHIERLMVIGNVMLLCQVEPRDAYCWFMELFVDSADWVMTPNVFGMALFSDGGIFATKPYICASNYWLKMSGDSRGPWCEDLDSLYWNFVNDQRELLVKNPRTSMMVRAFDKLDPARQDQLLCRAAEVIARLTVETDSD